MQAEVIFSCLVACQISIIKKPALKTFAEGKIDFRSTVLYVLPYAILYYLGTKEMQSLCNVIVCTVCILILMLSFQVICSIKEYVVFIG